MIANIIDSLTRSPQSALALDVVIKATLALAAAGVAAIVLRRSSAAARHLAWCLGLGAALVIPAMTLALPGWSWRVLPAIVENVRPSGPSAPDSPAPPTAHAGTAPQPAGPSLLETEEDPFRTAGLADRPPSRPTAPAASAPSWPMLSPSWSWLWAAWLAGVLVVLSAPIAGRIALRRWARNAERINDAGWINLVNELSAQLGLSRRIILLRSTHATMPMTWGWLRPVVMLPSESESWSLDRRRGVLLHELAHVHRRDCLTQTVARAACAVYWFHPLAWFAERRMRIERERACDDVVLLFGARASDYAGHLLEIARGLRAPRAASLAALAMARPSQIEGRLLAILDPNRRRVGPGRGMAALALLAAVLALVPMATVHLGARASTSTPEPVADNPPPTDPAARMTLTGRVLDPSGKPVPNAAMMVIVWSKYARRPLLERSAMGAMTVYEKRCDGSGRFRVELPRTTSARHYRLTLTAMAPGYGMGWDELDPDVDPPVADVSLRPELIVHGRMFDVKGQPAPDVPLRIVLINPVVRGEIMMPIIRPDVNELHRHDSPAWPGAAISDDQGRFTLRGLNRDMLCRVSIDDPRFAIPLTGLQTAEKLDASQPFTRIANLKVDPGPNPKPITIAVQPARTVVGHVTDADTGQPVPHTLVGAGGSYSEADADGRFRVPMAAGPMATSRFGIQAFSPDGVPYLMTFKQGEWPKGAIEQSVDITLKRGEVVRGKVTEEGTGRPVAGAVVRVVSRRAPGDLSGLSIAGLTGSDGTYRVAAPPGPGYVVVQGPDDDYVLQEFGGDDRIIAAAPGRNRLYAHAYRAVDLKAGERDHEVDLTLRKGVALRGRAVGPDGQPMHDGWVCSPLMLRTQADGGWKAFVMAKDHSCIPLRDGRFVLHGLDPSSAAEVPAFFLDPGRRLGAVARFTGQSGASGPVTVRLEPCGTARLRLVTPDGKPLDRHDARALASLVVTPGPMFQGPQAAKDGPLFCNDAGVVQLDPVNYKNRGIDFQSDAEGRLTYPALIPGATYRIHDLTAFFGGGEPAIRKEFTVKPGETLDLGDILIARPQRRNAP